MIVAITGANGFIGQHLARRFADAGCDVRPIVRRDVEQHTTASLLAGADVVVHCAGATRAASRLALRESNVGLTRRVLAESRDAKVGRFIFISSQAATGPAMDRESPVTEAMAPLPIEEYGRSKLDAEREVRACTDLPSVIVRPAAVYGPGDRDFLAMFRLARFGVAIHPGNREQWLSIIHVSDLADAIVRCAGAGEAVGGTYFLANEEPVQWGALFERAAECAGGSLTVDVQVPPPLVAVAATVGDAIARMTGHASLLTSEKVALSRPPYWVCSSELARRELGVESRIELQDGLLQTYDWYLANGWL
jgi:nucleoside-diphosphate-sugar epimerase